MKRPLINGQSVRNPPPCPDFGACRLVKFESLKVANWPDTRQSSTAKFKKGWISSNRALSDTDWWYWRRAQQGRVGDSRVTSTIGLLWITQLLHNMKKVTLNWIIADVSAVTFWSVWDLGIKFTWIQSVGCRAAEDFSELDSDAKSCSGLDSENQLRSFDSSRSYYEYVTLETFM